jgi:hypothetical protein
MYQLLKGTYVFKKDGKEIGRSTNLITNNGRKTLLQYLSGIKSDWASSIAIGAISTTPTLSDIELNFETARFPINLKTFKSAEGENPDLLILRCTLPASMYANIYEVGAYPNNVDTNISNINNQIFTDFSDLTGWVTDEGSTYITGYMPQVSSSPRIGAFSVELAQSTVFYNNTFSFNMNSYTDADNLQILAYNTVAGQVTITMTDVLNNSTSFVYNLDTNDEYQVLSVPFSNDSQFLGTIRSISIATDSTAVITIDAIKASITKELSTTDYIISKSVLDYPIAKEYGTALDIEYYIQLT